MRRIGKYINNNKKKKRRCIGKSTGIIVAFTVRRELAATFPAPNGLPPRTREKTEETEQTDKSPFHSVSFRFIPFHSVLLRPQYRLCAKCSADTRGCLEIPPFRIILYANKKYGAEI